MFRKDRIAPYTSLASSSKGKPDCFTFCVSLAGRVGVHDDTLTCWDVVDGVAHQREVVDDLVRAHAELLDHALGGVEPAAAHRVDQRDAAAVDGVGIRLLEASDRARKLSATPTGRR